MSATPLLSDTEKDFIAQSKNGLSAADADLVIEQVLVILEKVQAEIAGGTDPAAIVLTNSAQSHQLSRPIAAAILQARGLKGTFAADNGAC
jgi:hypothetical protein